MVTPFQKWKARAQMMRVPPSLPGGQKSDAKMPFDVLSVFVLLIEKQRGKNEGGQGLRVK